MTGWDHLEHDAKRILSMLPDEDRAVVETWVEEGISQAKTVTSNAHQQSDAIAGWAVFGVVLIGLAALLTVIFCFDGLPSTVAAKGRCEGWCAHEDHVAAYDWNEGTCTCVTPDATAAKPKGVDP